MQLNAIKQIEQAAKLDSDIISLAQGIPYLPSDDVVREAAIHAIERGYADKYSEPAGLYALREKIVEVLREEFMDYTTDEVVVTSGAMEGLNASILSVVNSSKNEVIVLSPVYAAYFKAIELAGAKTVEVVLNEREGWSVSLQVLKQAVNSKTAAVMICNPHNPTGSTYTKQQLDEIAQIAKESGCILITDEVYGNIIYNNRQLNTPARRAEFRDNVIRIVSFSKDFSLTGWRIGFLHTSRKNISGILGVHDTLVNCATVVSQYAAIAALENRYRIITRNLELYARNREVICDALDDMNEYFSYVMPQATYFVFPKLLLNTSGSEFALRLLTQAKVAVVPGEAFGRGGEGHVRLCFGRSEEEIRIAMDRIKRFIAEQ